MAPTQTKKRTVPDPLDSTPLLELSERLKNTTPEKREYWLNRLGGKPGTPDLRPKPKVFKVPQDIVMGFDNDGNMVAKTREMRRKKKPYDVKFTKNTWSMTPKKELKRKRKLGRR